MQKALAIAARIAGRVVGAAVATDSVIDAAPLRVIEHVEPFGTEFEVGALGHEKVLEQTHVEVPSQGNVHDVAAGVAEGQAFGRRESAGIEQQRTKYTGTGRIRNGRRSVRIADQVGKRVAARTIGHAGPRYQVVAVVRINAKRVPGLDGCETRQMPTSRSEEHTSELQSLRHLV